MSILTALAGLQMSGFAWGIIPEQFIHSNPRQLYQLNGAQLDPLVCHSIPFLT